MYNYVIVGYKNTLHLLSTHKNKATIRFEFLVMAFWAIAVNTHEHSLSFGLVFRFWTAVLRIQYDSASAVPIMMQIFLALVIPV